VLLRAVGVSEGLEEVRHLTVQLGGPVVCRRRLLQRGAARSTASRRGLRRPVPGPLVALLAVAELGQPVGEPVRPGERRASPDGGLPAAGRSPLECGIAGPIAGHHMWSVTAGRLLYPREMRPLRYSINVTLDGCCDHRAIAADDDLHRHAAASIDRADALLFGRVTYQMMEAAWRPPAATVSRPEWMEPFARTIDAAKKYVVSSTLEQVDWNAELVRGDLGEAVEQLKREPGNGLFVGGLKLPLALTELGLIDEYELVVHPRLVGHGPTLFAGLTKYVDLTLVDRLELGSGAVAMRYEPRR
jgi:dihydrofolate reductase